MPPHSMDALYLKQALDCAASRRGFCAPNPAVGAVVVKGDKVLASGCHWAAGEAHAEVAALAGIAEQAEGATIYVSLEPCCHQGRTPACTDLLIQHKVARVVYAFADPNPLVAGKGAAQLRQAGIEVLQLALPEADAFYQSYAYWTQTGRPWVTAKLAQSSDSMIAGPGGLAVAITGGEVKRYSHQQRLQSDAILTTAKTLNNDDPQMNVRLTETVEYIKKPVYVIDSHASLAADLQIYTTAASVTVFHAEGVATAKLEALGVRCVTVASEGEHVCLDWVIQYIGEQGVHDLWVEAGVSLFQAMIDQGLVDRVLLYESPKVLGPEATPGLQNSQEILAQARRIERKQYGQDRVCDIILAD